MLAEPEHGAATAADAVPASERHTTGQRHGQPERDAFCPLRGRWVPPCQVRVWLGAAGSRGYADGVSATSAARRDAVDADDEAVPRQRLEGLPVGQACAGRARPERGRAPLAERALEPRLPPQRLVAPPARRAARRERAHPAARHPREADGRPEVEERLRARPSNSRRCAPAPGATFVSTGSTSRPNAKLPTAAPCRARRRAARSGRPASRAAATAALRGGGLPRAGCSRAPATRGSRRPATRPRARRRRPALEPRAASAGRRGRPASAAASPRRRGSRRGRASAATAAPGRSRRTSPTALLSRRAL